MKKRFDEIDFLRAFGILGVIIVHILTYNLSSPLNKILWNYLQFVVVSFVFCSGFVLAFFYGEAFTSLSKTLLWYKKRFIRLFIPFFIYLVAHYSFWILFPDYFQGLGLSKNISYFFQSATFTGGTNLNWLPLLFLQLTFLFPIFTNIINNKKLMSVYVLFALLVTGYFTFFHFPYSQYRIVMWIPWSLVLIAAMYTAGKDKIQESAEIYKRHLILGVLSFTAYVSLLIYLITKNQSLNFYDHKYPPDFYYLFFGVALTFIFLIIGKYKIWANAYIKKFYFFVSNNSYQIFFIHYILLDLILTLSKKNTFLKDPVAEFLIILFLSLTLTRFFNKVSKSLFPKKA